VEGFIFGDWRCIGRRAQNGILRRFREPKIG
jgi:hypothetical protein